MASSPPTQRGQESQSEKLLESVLHNAGGAVVGHDGEGRLPRDTS